MRLVETSIDIAASAPRVWQVLADFDAYPSWNPFITRIAGEIAVGARLRVTIAPPGRKPMKFRPTLLIADRPHELCWRGRLFLPGLFDGVHSFRIEGNGEASRFHQTERFTGMLLGTMDAALFQATQAGFEAMNKALKARVEQSAG
jgi:hypothetical protein